MSHQSTTSSNCRPQGLQRGTSCFDDLVFMPNLMPQADARPCTHPPKLQCTTGEQGGQPRAALAGQR